MLDKIEFILGEAFSSLRRNTWMTFAAVTTSAMALFIFGGLGLLYLSVAGFAEGLQSRFEMSVFLKENSKPGDIGSAKQKIQAMPGVKSVVFNSKEVVLKKFIAQNPGIDVAGMGVGNPMPNEFVVSFSDLSKADAVEVAVKKLGPVEQVRVASEEQTFLQQSMGAIRWLGLVLGGLLLLTSGVLIYNTIRLTIVARRREITIMRLVGATRAMVWTPMLIEGMIQGVLGGFLATLVLWSAYYIVRALVSTVQAFQGSEGFPMTNIGLLMVCVGAAYGLICSFIAVREPRLRLNR